MNQSELPTVTANFAASVESEGASLTLRMTGSWDMNGVAFFDELVHSFEAEAARRSASRVTVDVSAVEFITSSCFKSLVHWIAGQRRLPVAQRYQVHFRTNPKLVWQGRSLQPLIAIGEGRVSVDS